MWVQTFSSRVKRSAKSCNQFKNVFLICLCLVHWILYCHGYFSRLFHTQHLLPALCILKSSENASVRLKESRKEGNVLFNDALNTFYLRLYGVRHMVKDHSDSEKGNPLPPHRLLLSINSKGSFICTIPQTG